MAGHVEVDERSLRRLVLALRAESDGKQLEKELVAELRQVAEPALQAVRASVLSMGSEGITVPSLRQAVADHTKISVRTGGRNPGVSIRSSKNGMPRGFHNAPKRLNATKGWRHQVFGSDHWVVQIGKPGWFDETLKAFKPATKKAAEDVLDNMAKRIDRRTKG